LKELPGRKSVLLVSDGFKISSLDDPTQTNQSPLSRFPRNSLAANKLGRLLDEANRASVVIYTMNATGLQTLGLTAADDASGRSSDEVEQQLGKRRNAAYENQEGLDVLARETGGIAIHNTNDLSRGIRRSWKIKRAFI
jgi:VWFA-related protein